tara:strand:- start:544 stop:1410 length:867 start_codon:yes stop_codon:yes gene_type:complete
MKSTKINIYDLYRNIDELKKKKNTSYNEVLIIIHERIKKSSLKERYKLIYEVPEYIFGVPSYNLNKCLAYLMKELRTNGFLVKYYFPKILYISWDPVEITNYKQEKKLYERKFKDLNKDVMRISNKPTHSSNFNNLEDKNNIEGFFENQPNISEPTTTQHTSSVFKPILNYDPNTIPTYNYYAYSSLNNNLVNEDFYIRIEHNSNNSNNSNNITNINSNDIDNSYLKTPQHLQNVQLLKDKRHKELDKNMNYQKNIIDYYTNDIETEIPFKNSIKKHNSKGKFILDLS